MQSSVWSDDSKGKPEQLVPVLLLSAIIYSPRENNISLVIRLYHIYEIIWRAFDSCSNSPCFIP